MPQCPPCAHDNFEVQGNLHDDLNLAVLAACRWCFPRQLPVIESSKGTGEKEVLFVLQRIDEESLDALLTPFEVVLLLKLTSAKYVVCDANRREVTVTVGKDGHETKTTSPQRFQSVSVARPSRKLLVFRVLRRVVLSTDGMVHFQFCRTQLAYLSLARLLARLETSRECLVHGTR